MLRTQNLSFLAFLCVAFAALAPFVSGAKAAGSDVESILKQGDKAGDRAVVSVDGTEFAFRWAPAGTFTMGSSKDGSGEVGGDVDFGVL